MVQFVSALCMLSLVTLGLLMMTELISSEQAWIAIAKVLVVFVIVLWAICVLKGFLPLALSALKTLLGALAITGIAFATIVILAIVFLVLGRRLSKKIDSRGDEI